MFRKNWFLTSLIFLMVAAVFAPVASANEEREAANEMAQQEANRAEEAVRTLFGILQPKKIDSASRRLEDLFMEGVQLERAGRMQEALRKYDLALKIKYSDPRVHMAIARIVENDNPALALFHYQSAFRFTIGTAANQFPAIEVMRRFLVGRYLQYALPINDPVVSAKLLELAMSLAPEDARLHAHLANAHFYMGMYEKSIQENRNAMVLGYEDGVLYTNIAAAFAQLGNKAEAETALIMALNADERDINEVLNLIRSANASDTLVTFDKLLGKDKVKALMTGSTKGHLEAAVEKMREGKTEEAVAEAKAAAAANPRHSHASILVGDLLRASGDTDGAMGAYREAMQRNPSNQLGLPRMGDLSFDKRDFLTAAKFYSDAMDMMQGRVERIDILDRTAVALASQKKHKEALELLDKWLKANPNAPEAFELSVRRAGILVDASRTSEAEQVLRGLKDRDKLNPAGYIVLHSFYKERGNDKKALETVNDGIIALQTARDQDPLDPSLYRDMARLYSVIGRDKEAQKALWEGGLRTSEKRFFANALFANDAETPAYDVLKAWIAQEPRNPEAILSYGWVAAKLAKDMPLALAKIDALALEFPQLQMAPIQRTRSYLYYAMGSHEKAIADIKAFLTSDELPQSAFFHRLWGLSAEALNKPSEALEHLKKAMKLDPDKNSDLLGRISRLEGSGR